MSFGGGYGSLRGVTGAWDPLCGLPGLEPTGSHLRGWRGGAGVERISEEESLVSVFTRAELLGLRCWFLVIRIHWELFNRIFSF